MIHPTAPTTVNMIEHCTIEHEHGERDNQDFTNVIYVNKTPLHYVSERVC